MKIHTWLTSGLAARDNSDNASDYLVWFPASLDTLSVAPLVGESESVPFYLTPKTSALRETSEGIVLLGVALGDLPGTWRFDNLEQSTERIDDIPSLLGSNFAYRNDGAAVVQLRGEFPIEQVQVVAGQNRPDTKRAIEVFRGVDGERQFHTMPELFPDEA
ncbi:hypothetical protein [Corynebacterium lujinxingii]|uniref:Uncharacterized protein n=1 Tax=Corynebacterium lujinxingii TaxID=2763010 RepID=A0A7H0JZ53_9CORY|nr:hypothetical protein [Corynebacterium lujinxingii]MBC3179302.1 hypothetical protein [Corynebacterium lujinxingii]NNO10177.1 hypothetical protein [Corynebacterium lujinxingii]QNP90319.1 hypothetical protein IAU68_00490 [Corynebacterium lujinxingii]